MNQVEALVQAGDILIDAPGASGRRPLHRAAGSNQSEICKFLLSKGAKVDEKDNSGRTPLHWACISNHVKPALILIENGANVFTANKSKNIPLHLSSEGGSRDIVSILVEKAGDKKNEMFLAVNNENETSFSLAKKAGKKDVTKLLKSLGDPNASSGLCIIQ